MSYILPNLSSNGNHLNKTFIIIIIINKRIYQYKFQFSTDTALNYIKLWIERQYFHWIRSKNIDFYCEIIILAAKYIKYEQSANHLNDREFPSHYSTHTATTVHYPLSMFEPYEFLMMIVTQRIVDYSICQNSTSSFEIKSKIIDNFICEPNIFWLALLLTQKNIDSTDSCQ